MQPLSLFSTRQRKLDDFRGHDAIPSGVTGDIGKAAIARSTRLARCDVKSTIGASGFFAARSSGVPFLEQRGLRTRSAVGTAAAFAARFSGVPFFDRRGRRAATRRVGIRRQEGAA
jgi:hypothetical protein